jgi:hypothetical protein
MFLSEQNSINPKNAYCTPKRAKPAKNHNGNAYSVMLEFMSQKIFALKLLHLYFISTLVKHQHRWCYRLGSANRTGNKIPLAALVLQTL